MSKPLRVVHLSTYDTTGGAARAAYRLHQGLLGLGIDSLMLVGRKSSNDPTVLGPGRLWSKALARVSPRLDRTPGRLLGFKSLTSLSWLPDWAVRETLSLSPDIVHLHWVCNGFLRPESLPRFGLPVVWTLHDMWPFTGAEHYTGESRRYVDGYDAPDEPRGFMDLDRWVWNRKRRAWPETLPLKLVADSRWLASRAKESVLFRDRDVRAINYGLDHLLFKPLPRLECRDALKIDPDRRVVLFGAPDATTDPRKGFDLLQRALLTLAGRAHRDRLAVAIFGADKPAGAPNLGFEAHYLGHLDDQRLPLAYSAADVMVVPSREEAFGQTSLEAMACGVPVAAFDVGGLPDTVEHQRTGYLARPFDTTDLADGIEWLLADPTRAKMLSRQCREKVERDFTLAAQAARYVGVYNEFRAGHT